MLDSAGANPTRNSHVDRLVPSYVSGFWGTGNGPRTVRGSYNDRNDNGVEFNLNLVSISSFPMRVSKTPRRSSGERWWTGRTTALVFRSGKFNAAIDSVVGRALVTVASLLVGEGGGLEFRGEM